MLRSLHKALKIVGSCEHSNEHFGSIKGRKFLDYLSDYWLLKKDSAPGSQFSKMLLSF
jgi:hypothetical protein